MLVRDAARGVHALGAAPAVIAPAITDRPEEIFAALAARLVYVAHVTSLETGTPGGKE